MVFFLLLYLDGATSFWEEARRYEGKCMSLEGSWHWCVCTTLYEISNAGRLDLVGEELLYAMLSLMSKGSRGTWCT
jgi:hypothetical protein